MYAIKYKKSAQKVLASMPRKLANKFMDTFEKIGMNPAKNRLDIKPLEGQSGLFCLRIGGWRALYKFEQNNLVIYVIGPRGDIYTNECAVY